MELSYQFCDPGVYEADRTHPFAQLTMLINSLVSKANFRCDTHHALKIYPQKNEWSLTLPIARTITLDPSSWTQPPDVLQWTVIAVSRKTIWYTSSVSSYIQKIQPYLSLCRALSSLCSSTHPSHIEVLHPALDEGLCPPLGFHFLSTMPIIILISYHPEPQISSLAICLLV